MIQTRFGHAVYCVAMANAGFYRDLLAFLGWSPLFETPDIAGFGEPGGGGLWFTAAEKAVANDYDGPGLNHLAFSAASQADVDAVAGQLAALGVEALFETPRHRPEFSAGEGETYYQVMFSSPDRILFEVVYTGPKQD
jgi:catechol 2,3-dioxygenase-like lactoylglutathione lyase family enzyme